MRAAWLVLIGAALEVPAMAGELGLRWVNVPPGSFPMGQADGEWDERPTHRVTITRGFRMLATPVTNALYERFDPDHRALRGQRGLSRGDDEAVLQVSWDEAAAFCRWLGERLGQPCRLPTEAEWEYACRAGTETPYWTGAELPAAFWREQEGNWDPRPVDLTVGRTPANPWGLHDLHGLVEEWCADWYGPYPHAPASDPVGAADGLFRVTRGGSHNTRVAYLRSANRAGAMPEDRSYLIGFRPVLGEPPSGAPTPPPAPPNWAVNVRQGPCDWADGPSPDEPSFAPPRRFVHLPAGADGPLYARHNHCPTITWCPNGDLLACWFSCRTEAGREMTIVASRLRRGAAEWEPAAEFFKAPDRNMTGSALYVDAAGTLFHLNGLDAGDGWGNLALTVRTSRDNGATWSRPRFANAEHQLRNQVISGTSALPDGTLIQPCDAHHSGNGGTAIHLSRDGGATWLDPGAGTPRPTFAAGTSGGTIAGIHAGVVALRDGRLLAFGRGDTIAGRMPRSLSADLGRTWTYSPSEWPPISSGQRLVLLRLREGPLLFCSFTDSSSTKEPHGLSFAAADGTTYLGYGAFAAVSFDEGETWPVRRLLTPGAGDYDGGAWTGSFQADATHAEPRGYLAATQSPDGLIQLVSSAVHYRFNLAWLRALPAPP